MEHLPILQALCKSTENALEPIVFNRTDFTVIQVSYYEKVNAFRVDCFQGLSRKKISSALYESYSKDLRKVISLKGGEIALKASGASTAVIDWFDNLPEKKHLAKKNKKGKITQDRYSWLVPCTDINCILIRHCWPSARIVMNTSAKLMYTKTLLEFFSSGERAKIQAAFKEEGTIPEIPEAYDSGNRGLDLKDYQKVAMLFGKDTDFGLLMEQGTGKSPTFIRLTCLETKESEEKGLVLIVCPQSCRQNWKAEIKRFSTLPGSVYIIDGTAGERMSLLAEALRARQEENKEIVFAVISIDTVWRDIALIKHIPWTRVCVDESHQFKSPRSKRWQGLKVFQEHEAKKTILTGTPTAGSLMDLWTQLEFLGPGKSGFTTFKAFKAFYGKYTKIETAEGNQVESLIGFQNIPFIHERLSRYTFVIDTEEADLDLPEIIPSLWEVDFPRKFMEAYNSLAEDLTVEIETGLASGRITAEHVLTKLIRLAQITSGYVKTDDYFDEDTGVMITGEVIQIDPDNNPKVKESLEMMRDLPEDEKAIFWVVFKEDIRFLEERFKAEGFDVVTYYGGTKKQDRQVAIDRFNNDPKCRIFLGNPKSAGTGINLLGYDKEKPEEYDTDATLMVFFSRNFDFISFDQAKKRANRIGSRRSLTVRNLFVPNTIDETIVEALDTKKGNATLVKDLGSILKNVLGMGDRVNDLLGNSLTMTANLK